mmetsp:Transcript_3194/g.5559  ORF Transcript_3194/g.5559 Transcript_3194/m.5559 type:complete len:83 (+) Transcript_3194:4430-4678(+)
MDRDDEDDDDDVVEDVLKDTHFGADVRRFDLVGLEEMLMVDERLCGAAPGATGMKAAMVINSRNWSLPLSLSLSLSLGSLPL